MPHRQPIIVAVLLSGLCAAARGAPPARYLAVLSDGARIEGNQLSDWHTAVAEPKLDGQPLLDASRPLRWLRDRRRVPGVSPVSFVELVNGDCLPGLVIAYQGHDASRYDALPPHFVVEPSVTLAPRPPTALTRIRVIASQVRRIVWRRPGIGAGQAGTLSYRDGRRLRFRAIRFDSRGATLLLEEERRRVRFREMAELRLVPPDPWDACFDELSVLAPEGQSRLLVLETTSGLIATSSLLRFQAYARGRPEDSDRWVHAVQPAWSLDALWVPSSDIVWRRMFAPQEVPLTRLLPMQVREHSPLSGTTRPWRRNRNVYGGPLRSGGREFGWGLGVHALSELHFPLTGEVTAFRTTLGIDRASDSGGCVLGQLLVDDAQTPPLEESPLLVGSQTTCDLQVLLPAGQPGPKRLVLRVDPAHDNRPPGADPLDIRDAADWLEPMLLLDPEQLSEQVGRRRLQTVWAWNGWTADRSAPAQAAGGHVSWLCQWDDFAAPPGRFVPRISAGKQPWTLRRQLRLGPGDRFLMVAASHYNDQSAAPKIEIRIDGRQMGVYAVPYRNRSQPQPAPIVLRLPAAAIAADRPLEFEIRQLPSETPIQWHAIGRVEQLPMLHGLFEDEGQFTRRASPHDHLDATAMLYTDDRHSGLCAVKVTPGARFSLATRQPLPVRAVPRWGEFRYLRFAFRKSGEGRIGLELNRADADGAEAIRYDAGTGPPSHGQAKRVWGQQLPDRWIVITRDLYGDFGAMDVSGITLSAPDGEYALFDHIYLARAAEDFERITTQNMKDE